MLSLPPPPQRFRTTSTPADINVRSKQGINQETRARSSPANFAEKLKTDPIIGHQPRRTHPLVWCVAVICLLFSLVIILSGVATLTIFLVIKPRYPSFDIPNASLSAIYFDSPEYFNGDFTLLANFTNPNNKIDLKFEYLALELFFSDSLIAIQSIEPFSQRRGETTLGQVHMISSLVYLPSNLALGLQKEVQNNRVQYNIRGSFKVRAKMGFAHFGYWLNARCRLEMTGPPRGVLVARNCITKR
ncbi:hypothetical protein Nepgr_027312 [Nepenthes gracilis]|uniref:Late embryogenesis abundant protein LEA-2 subgroup domain-containing protein n=1 Tax=Nepenthes gracilis TaxID=150966 RepID=A0AAD3Y2Z6_NEPGR|nr:hypothetical protein Nepgr_027312 [Nepenthes gracilis]